MIVKAVFSNFQFGSFLFHSLWIIEDAPKTIQTIFSELSMYESSKISSKICKITLWQGTKSVLKFDLPFINWNYRSWLLKICSYSFC